MKKILFGLSLLSLSFSTSAQNKTADANAFLKKTSAKYRGMKTIRAQFNILIENLKDKTNQSQKAILVVSGKKFSLDLQDQKLLCDGSTLYTYSPEVNEVQIDHYKPEMGEINPSTLFSIYESGFSALTIGESVVNKKKLVAIDLTPNDKKKNYFKIRLWIEKSTNLIQMGKVFQKNGNNLIYTIKNLSQQPTATDKEFAFDRKLYPGVEVIDMR